MHTAPSPSPPLARRAPEAALVLTWFDGMAILLAQAHGNILRKIHIRYCAILCKPHPHLLLARRAPEAALVLITVVWAALPGRAARAHRGHAHFRRLPLRRRGLAVGLVSLRCCAASPGAKSAGGAVGLAIVAGYGGQTIGLQHITSSESAFLTALYVPAVPLLQWLGARAP